MVHSVHGVVWVNTVLMSAMWMERPVDGCRGRAGVCHAARTRVYFIDAIQRYGEHVLRNAEI